jgi:hypothetical protein
MHKKLHSLDSKSTEAVVRSTAAVPTVPADAELEDRNGNYTSTSVTQSTDCLLVLSKSADLKQLYLKRRLRPCSEYIRDVQV